ncbi:adenylate/guanylate cyclase domain-containing protein [Amycolatopsis antarctica]|uniref:Adenylate/guanylate cyclase domain-containing protein n=1 Tax=Amycolatopsis antarctica TaxID=1854586 RepID=A0A263D4X7_9PSEU|nr:adenylate/guanylate cyclase domain-containing protein [Amycolatopsis antarctica]OZM73259.1 adenylate/guanylate cyclase domain-containing protein [Amycolatopsis antarctica]
MPRLFRPARFRAALRTSLGFAVLGVGSSVIGSAVVFLLLVLQGIPGDTGDRGWVLVACAAGYVGLSLVAGSAWTAILQRRTAVWFALGRPPSPDEARRALRLPAHLSFISGTLWAAGALTLGILTWTLGSALDALGVFLVIAIGGLTTVGLTYLIAEWVGRPVMTLALDVSPPQDRLPTTVLIRLAVTWALAGGVPLLGVLLVLVPPDLGTREPTPSLVVLAVTGLVTGAVATALLARAVASPLRQLRRALAQVARGRTDISVPVDDASEIGMLQASVNDLVAGLREQERMRDLFGRHVGADVARHALEHGASLSGDVREVTALFVDVVDSTVLAYRLPPQELVDMLNRLFDAVVGAVGTHGGLVNKFQGDAALCVFGAPSRLADPSTSALQAARAIRDAVAAQGELDLGIGVSSGVVFAGQLGTSSRFEYTVIGDAVNEAARLTESAKGVPGRILASSGVIETCAARERERWSPHEPIRLRGRNEPTSTWLDDGTPGP